jgi:hypothetical protein
MPPMSVSGLDLGSVIVFTGLMRPDVSHHVGQLGLQVDDQVIAFASRRPESDSDRQRDATLGTLDLVRTDRCHACIPPPAGLRGYLPRDLVSLHSTSSLSILLLLHDRQAGARLPSAC